MFLRRFLKQRLSNWSQDTDGSVSIEFVLVFPLLALWLGASFVWFDAFRAKSLMSKTAYTVTDYTSRLVRPTQAELDRVFLMHKKLLPRRQTADGWLRLSSICWNGTDHRVVWSYIGDDTYANAIADPNDDIDPRLLPLTDDEIPLEIIPSMSVNDSVILVDVYSYWKPLVSWAGFQPTDLNVSLVSRPRFVDILRVVDGLPGYPFSDADGDGIDFQLCPDD